MTVCHASSRPGTCTRDALRRRGMPRGTREGLACAVERLTPDLLPAAAVEVIPGQRVPDGSEVDPNLVGPARHRYTGGKAEAVIRF